LNLELPLWQTGQPGGDMRVVPTDIEGPVLSEEPRAVAKRIVARYPTRRSALIPLLYLVQSEVGWVPRQGMREVAEILGLTTAEVEAVATFYTMLKLHPCGRYVLSICTNPSCALLGGRRLYDKAKALLGEQAERMSEDGLFTLEEEECLAACDKAPVLALNYVYYDKVTDEQLEQLIASIREGRVPEAARGGVPGELKEISKVLAGVGNLDTPAAVDAATPTRSPTARRAPGDYAPPASEETEESSDE
jgi:NADH-quinone oxidoreductase subunit E